MAIINSNGVLLVDAIPVHQPTGNQATLARLNNSLTFFFYNGSWNTVRLNAEETYTGNIIPDNANLGTALQSLENAIESIVQDGNHSYVARANAIEDVEPSNVEVPNPINGDTCDISLTSGKVEKWVFSTSSWSKSFTLDYKDVTNLNYVASTSSGTVESSTGSNAIISAVSSSKAGLMLSSHKTKLDFITVTGNINLDNIKNTLVNTIQTVEDTNSIDLTKTGTKILADLRIAGVQGTGMSVTITSDGLKVVYNENRPPSYGSLVTAQADLGSSKKFIYTRANLDGATENSLAWTNTIA